MILRRPRMIDVPALAQMLVDLHPRTRFVEMGEARLDVAKRVLAQAIQRHGGTTDGGSFVGIVETGEGVICGLMVGVLQRVYLIGDKLYASDVFLVAAPDAPLSVLPTLLNGFLNWAESAPDCVEIQLTWSDALPSGYRMAPVYRRLGFERSGEMYRRATPMAMARKAAA